MSYPKMSSTLVIRVIFAGLVMLIGQIYYAPLSIYTGYKKETFKTTHQYLGNFTVQNTSVNQEWLAKRKELISQDLPRKLYMFAYMRGGSTIGGMLYQTDPTAVFWYEPLDQFYMAYHAMSRWSLPFGVQYYKNGIRRKTPPYEEMLFVDYISNLLTCNYHALPIETFAAVDFHIKSKPVEYVRNCMGQQDLRGCVGTLKQECGTEWGHLRNIKTSEDNSCLDIIQATKQLKPSNFSNMVTEVNHHFNKSFSSEKLKKFWSHYQCILENQRQLEPCLPQAIKLCKAAKLHAMKVCRSNMVDLEDLILKVPDIHVIYFVRDPRAMTHSVVNTEKGHLRSSNGPEYLTAEAVLQCQKMTEDFNEYVRLNAKYPGVFLLTKYENLVTDPIEFGNKIYQHIGLGNSSNEWATFMKTALKSEFSDGQYGLMRKNGTESIAKWSKELSNDFVERLNKICSSTIEQMEYQLK